jgi:hypothetical protein
MSLETEAIEDRSGFDRENRTGAQSRVLRKQDGHQPRNDLRIAASTKTQGEPLRALIVFRCSFTDQSNRRDTAAHEILLDQFGIIERRQLPAELNEKLKAFLSLWQH